MADLATIEEVARGLIADLAPEGWTFRWSRSKLTLGEANYRAKTISLSKARALHEPEAETLDTIMHEIAHAQVGPGHGHDYEWRVAAKRLGATPKANSTSPDTLRQETAPWVGVCPVGHEVGRRYFTKPRSQRAQSCGFCHPGRFSPDHLITYVKREVPADVR